MRVNPAWHCSWRQASGRRGAARAGPARQNQAEALQPCASSNAGGSCPGTIRRPLMACGMSRIQCPWSPGAHGSTPAARVRSMMASPCSLVTSSARPRTRTLQPMRCTGSIWSLEGDVRVLGRPQCPASAFARLRRCWTGIGAVPGSAVPGRTARWSAAASLMCGVERPVIKGRAHSVGRTRGGEPSRHRFEEEPDGCAGC
jgi:hypothetical protein